MNKKLIIGIGNEGREDDGLGWRFLEMLEQRGLPDADVEYRYQLQVEDAELIAKYDEVWFVDADRRRHEIGWKVEQIEPHRADSFTSHSLSPDQVLYLAETLYKKKPECHLLGISGESFELNIGLTDYARQNLATAFESFLLA